MLKWKTRYVVGEKYARKKKKLREFIFSNICSKHTSKSSKRRKKRRRRVNSEELLKRIQNKRKKRKCKEKK
jgi:hypothetical protein